MAAILLDERAFDRRKRDERTLAAVLTENLWGAQGGLSAKDCSAFLNHYFAQLSLVDFYDLTIETHRDVVDLVTFVRDRKSSTLRVLKDSLNQVRPRWLGATPMAAVAAVELAVHIWLMIEMDDWGEDETLVEFISGTFPTTMSTPSYEKLPTSFNAYSLDRVGGIAIEWTSSLADHLKLNEDSSHLSVYQQPSFLRCYQNQASR